MSQKCSIVVFEDSRDDVFLIREALTGAGLDCDVRVIQDGGEAASFLQNLGKEAAPPDLFLIDLNLPKADGFQIIRMVRDRPQCKATPIIVMSSSDSQRDRSAAQEIGVSGYFCKPLELDEFMKLGGMVQTILNQAPGHHGATPV